MDSQKHSEKTNVSDVRRREILEHLKRERQMRKKIITHGPGGGYPPRDITNASPSITEEEEEEHEDEQNIEDQP